MSVLARLLGVARPAVDAVLRHRDRLPAPVNRIIDHIADNPDGPLGRLAASSLGEVRPEDIPPPTVAPDVAITVYIGPTNYAEQGWAWARSLERLDGVAARNMAVDVPGGFSFRADTIVPVPVHASSEAWQRAEFDAVTAFTHVLFEAERPLFGRLFGRDVEREQAALAEAGVSTAFLAHGTDARLPSRHLALTPWSPFTQRSASLDKLERDASRNIALLERSGRPVFVSTPDLLVDLPGATWCPVVVDVERWSRKRADAEDRRMRVAHVPSKSAIKGTPLVEPTLDALAAAGTLEYERVSGVPSARMPEIYGAADVMLDQFRLGSYGVAACEAMASGCVVVGHVVPFVRDRVRELSGRELPIVEATPDDLTEVLRRLAGDPAGRQEIAAAGREFVAAVHDGTTSARALMEGWIHR